MNGSLYLAWRYIARHRGKTAILVVGVALTVFLPLATQWTMERIRLRWEARAAETPLVVGAKGSRFDLVLRTLYFQGESLELIKMGDVESIRESGLAQPIPLLLGHTARDFPIVGTSLAYFDFRGLQIASGKLPGFLGDCVVGSTVAQRLGLKPGDRLLSDPENVFDLAGAYPLDMAVVGVLAKTGTADDEAVFCDIKTAWVLRGIGHGHEDLSKTQNEAAILKREGETIVANASLRQYTRITPENVSGFHIHAAPEDLPVSAIIALPADKKSSVLLRGRYVASGLRTQILQPPNVVAEIMGMVLRIGRLLHLCIAIITAATLLFLALVVLLSLRLRRDERRTMHHIGCSRGVIVRLHLLELSIIVILGIVVAVVMAAAAMPFADQLIFQLIL